MTTKLKLNREEKVITSTQKYAKSKSKSLSHLVENYLKHIGVEESKKSSGSLKVSRLRGVIKLPDNYDYKVELTYAIYKKHKK